MVAPTAQNISDLTKALSNLENALLRNNNLIPRRNPNSPSGGGGSSGGRPSTTADKAREKRLKQVIGRLEALQTRSYSRIHAQNIKNAQIELKAIQESITAREREIRLAEHRANAEDLAFQRRAKHEERFGHVIEGIQDGLHRFFGRPSVVDGAEGLVKEFSQMLGAGIEWSFKQYVDSAKLGIKQEELIKLQKQYSRLYVSMGQANNRGIDFADAVKRGSDQLDAYTSTNEAAGELAASNLDYAYSFGLTIKDSQDFASKLNKQFSVLNSNLSITDEQFKNLTNSIKEDSDLREWMLQLSDDEIKKHLDGNTALYSYAIAMGKTEKAAGELVNRYNSMFPKKKAKDYLKETLKTQAVMGAMGLGDKAQEYGALRHKAKYGTLSGEEQIRLTQIKGQMAETSAMWKGLDIAHGAIMDRFEEVSGAPFDQFAKDSTKLDKSRAQDEQKKKDLEAEKLKGPITTWFAETYKFFGAMSTWFKDTPGTIIGGIVGGLATMLGIKTLVKGVLSGNIALGGFITNLIKLGRVLTVVGLVTTSAWMVYENWEDMLGGLKLLIQDLSKWALSSVVGLKNTIVDGLGSLQDKYNSWVKSWESFSFVDSLSSIMSPFKSMEDYFSNSLVASYFDSFINTLFNFDDRLVEWLNNSTIGKLAKEIFTIPNTTEVVNSSGLQNDNILQYTHPQVVSKETITNTIQKETAKDEKIVRTSNEGNILSQELIKLLSEQNKMNQQSLAFQKQIAETNEKMSKPENMWFQRFSYDNTT